MHCPRYFCNNYVGEFREVDFVLRSLLPARVASPLYIRSAGEFRPSFQRHRQTRALRGVLLIGRPAPWDRWHGHAKMQAAVQHEEVLRTTNHATHIPCV